MDGIIRRFSTGQIWMSSAGLPESFDPTVAAREAFAWSGDVPVSDFARLADLLVSQSGMVRVSLHAAFGAERQPTMVIRLAAQLEQSCQRCLQPVTVVIDHEHTVAWVADAAALERFDAMEEDLDADAVEYLPMPDSSRVDTLVLVEDELMLSLPIVPMHEECALPVTVADSGEEHPFAALAQLKTLKH
ncbi:MAG: YceD family protein [Fluviibacter sp.]